MKNLLLRLNEDLFSDIGVLASNADIPKSKYITKAIAYYNNLQKRQNIRKQFEIESKLVNDVSSKILKEFELLEDDYETV